MDCPPKMKQLDQSELIKIRSLRGLFINVNPEQPGKVSLFKKKLKKSFNITEILKKLSDQDERLLFLLKKKEKQPNEVRMLVDLTKDLQYFRKINQSVINQQANLHYNICKNLRYEYYHKGDIIFYDGEDPLKFYIIIKGKALALIPKSEHQLEYEKSRSLNLIDCANLKRLLRNHLFYRIVMKIFIVIQFIKMTKKLPSAMKKIKDKFYLQQATLSNTIQQSLAPGADGNPTVSKSAQTTPRPNAQIRISIAQAVDDSPKSNLQQYSQREQASTSQQTIPSENTVPISKLDLAQQLDAPQAQLNATALMPSKQAPAKNFLGVRPQPQQLVRKGSNVFMQENFAYHIKQSIGSIP